MNDSRDEELNQFLKKHKLEAPMADAREAERIWARIQTRFQAHRPLWTRASLLMSAVMISIIAFGVNSYFSQSDEALYRVAIEQSFDVVSGDAEVYPEVDDLLALTGK